MLLFIQGVFSLTLRSIRGPDFRPSFEKLCFDQRTQRMSFLGGTCQFLKPFNPLNLCGIFVLGEIHGRYKVLGKGGKPVAKLVRYERVAEQRRPGALRGKIKIADDFDELPDDIARAFGMMDR